MSLKLRRWRIKWFPLHPLERRLQTADARQAAPAFAREIAQADAMGAADAAVPVAITALDAPGALEHAPVAAPAAAKILALWVVRLAAVDAVTTAR